MTDALCVLVDDVRRFVDDRDCLVYRTSHDAVAGLRALAEADTAVDQLWLDHDLGGDDTVRPVLALLDQLDHDGHRLTVDRVFVITSNPSGANMIRLAMERLSYREESLYSLLGGPHRLSTRIGAVEAADRLSDHRGQQGGAVLGTSLGLRLPGSPPSSHAPTRAWAY